jgi:hypothetical protein
MQNIYVGNSKALGEWGLAEYSNLSGVIRRPCDKEVRAEIQQRQQQVVSKRALVCECKC